MIRLPAETPARAASSAAGGSAQAGSLFHTYLSAARQAGETEKVSETICVLDVFASWALTGSYLPGALENCRDISGNCLPFILRMI